MAASRRSAGRYWTHNDSDDGPVIYCLDEGAASCGAWTVAGAEAFDWEDIAAGPGPDPGIPYLYIGDIGDNLGVRTSIVVYRVAEPEPGASGITARAEVLTLRYPDGPHDSEALMVHPTSGDVYVVVKEAAPSVYVARAPLTAGATRTLEKVAELPIGGGTALTSVTGADISPDGTRVALCTYAEGFELVLPPGAAGFDGVWAQAPRPLVLGPRPQGEAIAYRADGGAVVTTSERRFGAAPIHQVERGS